MKFHFLNSKNGIPLFAVLPVVVTAAVLGYWRGYSSKSTMDRIDREPAQACSIQYSEDANDEDTTSDQHLAGGLFDSEYLALLRKHHLEEKDRRISVLFPKSELGISLSRTVVLSGVVGPKNGSLDKILTEDFKLIENDSKASYDIIQRVLKTIGSELPSEHLFLIRFVGKLDLDISEKIEFYSKELTKAYKEKEGENGQIHAMLLTVLTSMIQLGVDYSIIEPPLKQALLNSNDNNLRMILLGLYESRFPEQAGRLREDMEI